MNIDSETEVPEPATNRNKKGATQNQESSHPCPDIQTDDTAMEDGDGFIPVGGPKQRFTPRPIPVEQLCGVHLCRFGSYKELDEYPIPFKAIFEALMTIDPQAAIVPFNRDTARALGLPLLLRTNQDYKTMMDITLMNWGKPSERRGKLALSFYIASAVITPDLAHLKKSCHLQDVLKASKFNISPHILIQTDSKPLAFFSGKSPDHTWREDLSDRFQIYMDNYLQEDNDIANIFGEDFINQVPKQIPFYLKPATIRSKNHKTQAVVIYVGAQHLDLMNKFISKIPFEDVELVPMSTRRKNTQLFDQQVQLHTFLCQDCSAVKLRHTSENLRTFLKPEIRKDNVVGTHVMDVAEASSTATEGTLYIQCLAEHKEKIIAYLETYLKTYHTKYPEDGEAVIVYPRSHTSDTSASATQTLNTWTKNQAYFYNRLAKPQGSNTKPRQTIPGAVSFADMAAGRHIDDKNRPEQSEMSSPTNSRSTVPSIREQQLEERIRLLEAQLLQSHSSRSPSMSTSSKSTYSSAKSVKTDEFQLIVAQQMKMIQSLADSNRTTNERMEQQNDLITDLRQTVAELILKIGDCESDSSTITSSDQRKRSKISHNTYNKNPLNHHTHPSNAGTAKTPRVPPDPDPEHTPVEQSHDTAAEDAGMEEETPQQDIEDTFPQETELTDGGIPDDDILAHMSQTYDEIHTDSQFNENPRAPCGHNDPQC